MLIEIHFFFYLSVSTFYSHIHVFKLTSLSHRPLGPENLLLRGARLKNTREIFGELVCFEKNVGVNIPSIMNWHKPE